MRLLARAEKQNGLVQHLYAAVKNKKGYLGWLQGPLRRKGSQPLTRLLSPGHTRAEESSQHVAVKTTWIPSGRDRDLLQIQVSS